MQTTKIGEKKNTKQDEQKNRRSFEYRPIPHYSYWQIIFIGKLPIDALASIQGTTTRNKNADASLVFFCLLSSTRWRESLCLSCTRIVLFNADCL